MTIAYKRGTLVPPTCMRALRPLDRLQTNTFEREFDPFLDFELVTLRLDIFFFFITLELRVE